MENYYVNGRYVKNRILTRAIEDAYKGFLMQRQFPFVSLQIQMIGNGLDVNVHPTKMEVRFSGEQEVYHAVYRAVSEALYEKELIPEVTFEKKAPAPKPETKERAREIPEPFERSRMPQVIREEGSYGSPAATPAVQRTSAQARPDIRQSASAASEKKQPKQNETGQAPRRPEPSDMSVRQTGPAPRQETFIQQPLLSEEARTQHRLIGQVFDTYWLVQYGDFFYIIDQHAAHEKVLYERIVKELQSREITSQYLSPPIVVSMTLEEEALLKEHMELFAEFGFELEHFGGREYNIRAVPANLYGVAEEKLFLEILGSLGHEGNTAPEILMHRLATAACKAAVKGNQRLSAAEADRLIDELLGLENPYHCPHGRPTIVSMSRTELEKKFRRIV